MKHKIIAGIMLALVSMGVLTLAFTSQPARTKSIEQTNTLVLEFDFLPPAVTESPVYDSVTMPGLPQYGAPGEPVLPFKIVRALIPQGRDVLSVNVTASDRKVLEGSFYVGYGETPLPISSDTRATFQDQPNQKIYGSANPFPRALFSQMSEQYMRGHKILMLKLHPVQFIPKTGKLSYFERMTVTINTMVSSNASLLFRNLQQDRELVLDIVDNPSEVESYTQTANLGQPTSLVNPSESHEYVIITNDALRPSFQPLIDWKTQKGLNATTVLVEDIMDDPDYHCDGLFGDGYGIQFNGTQAHVRNFIKDAYLNWETEYVLLGGDDEIIPSKDIYCYTSDATDNIPCDMYYGNLDGNWDNDNDTIFGEGVYYFEGPENGTAGEEADFFAEVYIGRATVDNPDEATNFVSKTLAYEQNTDATYLKKALMIGETLDSITQGGNGKDLVTEIIPQYTTTRLYNRDWTFSSNAVINEMNSGIHIVNHEGHAGYKSVMGLSASDVNNLTNTEYFIAYSVGCYSAAFDNATSGFDEAIAEHFISNSHGAFAYIGNTRYGWYLPGSTDGPGARYDRSFFNVLSDGVRSVGKALQLSKEQEPLFHRWTYFTLNLLGDPETEIVTAIKAPTAHFETTPYLWFPPSIGGLVALRGTAKRGTALGATFSNFTIEFSHVTNLTFWMTTGIDLTNNGESEVINETLAVWNTNLVDEGTYALRLTASDTDGNVGEDRAIRIVHNLTVHNIDTGLNYLTMQEAINAPETSDGHTILVDEGIHYEHLVVNKSVSLIGESRITTIIDGRHSGHPIKITANNVTVSEFTIQNGGSPPNASVILEHSNYSRIINNIFTFTRDWLQGDHGVRLNSSSFNTISGNTITKKSCGIHLDESFHNTISSNNITANNGYGIHFDDSSNNIVTDNRIASNDENNIWLSDSSYNSISGNDITNNDYGVYLMDSSDNSIYHNNFINNTNQVETINSTNVWDNSHTSGGNYWSDCNLADLYSGPYQNETGNDGIYDEPYVINQDNRDNYPLAHPYGSIRNLNTTIAYLRVQPAINAPETLDGHTILVEKGEYHENLVVNKSISLVGECPHTTVIDGNWIGNTVNVTKPYVKIEGFTIQNGVYGIHLASDNNTVATNIITQNSWGIGAWLGDTVRTDGNTIEKNNITENSCGIFIYISYHNKIMSNKISSTKTAANDIILYDNASWNTISGNSLHTSGIHFVSPGGRYNIITENNFYAGGINLGSPDSIGNVIYHNNFFSLEGIQEGNPGPHFFDKGYPRGNYWSDYAGDDLYGGPYQNETGSDGIGDIAYVIDENNQDNYPLMNPYILGDANHDGYVNVWDLGLMSDAWLTENGDLDYNPHVDFNMDDTINIWDLRLMSDYWLEEAPILRVWLTMTMYDGENAPFTKSCHACMADILK